MTSSFCTKLNVKRFSSSITTTAINLLIYSKSQSKLSIRLHPSSTRNWRASRKKSTFFLQKKTDIEWKLFLGRSFSYLFFLFSSWFFQRSIFSWCVWLHRELIKCRAAWNHTHPSAQSARDTRGMNTTRTATTNDDLKKVTDLFVNWTIRNYYFSFVTNQAQRNKWKERQEILVYETT